MTSRLVDTGLDPEESTQRLAGDFEILRALENGHASAEVSESIT